MNWSPTAPPPVNAYAVLSPDDWARLKGRSLCDRGRDILDACISPPNPRGERYLSWRALYAACSASIDDRTEAAIEHGIWRAAGGGSSATGHEADALDGRVTYMSWQAPRDWLGWVYVSGAATALGLDVRDIWPRP